MVEMKSVSMMVFYCEKWEGTHTCRVKLCSGYLLFFTVKYTDMLLVNQVPYTLSLICFLRKFIESVDRLIELGDRRICYAHFGDAASSLVMLLRFKNQLIRWQEIIKSELLTGHPGVIERCIERLLRNDPELAGFESMPSEMQLRERNFVSNSIKGFIGFLNGDKLL